MFRFGFLGSDGSSKIRSCDSFSKITSSQTFLRVIALRIAVATTRATIGGKAFPTCRYAAVLPPVNSQSAGKLCKRATIRTVSRGMRSNGAVEFGAASATPIPSTDISRHWAFARVGPKSGPPCFFDPPTIVGAILCAFAAQASAPGQPFSAICGNNASPTEGVSPHPTGHEKCSASAGRRATITKRGRNCGTPNSDA